MPDLPDDIEEVVAYALKEDVGSGDLTAELIANEAQTKASVISREKAILCGIAWFNEVYKQLDNSININWLVADGDQLTANQSICKITGSARNLLTGERTALNFLQTLSSTATMTNELVILISNLNTQILDTRKTLPGLRKAQKYAVLCGGGLNHRMGLYDAILIKENHIFAAGNISEAARKAKNQNVPLEIEVETLDELQQALAINVDSILLDNFSLEDLHKAVAKAKGKAKLEASGNINKENLRSIAETGVDFISIGSLTKHVHAIDFSMRFGEFSD
jgi:nicotinate-nucleotide pyrophosphorylase (carboxylating)